MQCTCTYLKKISFKTICIVSYTRECFYSASFAIKYLSFALCTFENTQLFLVCLPFWKKTKTNKQQHLSLAGV